MQKVQSIKKSLSQKTRYTFDDLLQIMELLTSPEGCPWDKEQTHESIAKNALEEAQELQEAIESGKAENIKKEAGDVLLQAVFHGDIGRRNGTFTTHDIVDSLCKKLVSRHTHVFGEDKAVTAEDSLKFWNRAKENENRQNKT